MPTQQIYDINLCNDVRRGERSEPIHAGQPNKKDPLPPILMYHALLQNIRAAKVVSWQGLH